MSPVELADTTPHVGQIDICENYAQSLPSGSNAEMRFLLNGLRAAILQPARQSPLILGSILSHDRCGDSHANTQTILGKLNRQTRVESWLPAASEFKGSANFDE